MSSQQPEQHGPPYAPKTAAVGGRPTVGVDVAICAVFLFLFACGAAGHMAILQINMRRGHKFLMSGLTFGFCHGSDSDNDHENRLGLLPTRRPDCHRSHDLRHSRSSHPVHHQSYLRSENAPEQHTRISAGTRRCRKSSWYCTSSSA